MKKATVDKLLDCAAQMERERPVYRLGGNGSDGTCDCIGLIIGALGRCGVTWRGIHGSNWAARNECARLRSIGDSPQRGDLALKSRGPGESGYALPARYKASADRLDYYHAGLVTQTEPLVILHCSSKGITRDTKRGKWAWCAELSMVDYGGAEEIAPPCSPPAEEALPVLRKGAWGEAVTRMQQLLLQHGMTLPRYGADGSFGAETLSALKRFQRGAGLAADGVCGPLTWAALKGEDT